MLTAVGFPSPEHCVKPVCECAACRTLPETPEHLEARLELERWEKGQACEEGVCAL